MHLFFNKFVFFWIFPDLGKCFYPNYSYSSRICVGWTGIRLLFQIHCFAFLPIKLCNPVCLSTSFSGYFKCCCLHSLRITSSSLFFIEKVSTSQPCFLDLHRTLLNPNVYHLIWDDLFHLTFKPSCFCHIFQIPPAVCICLYSQSYVLLLLMQVMTKEAAFPSCASLMCHLLRCPISCFKAP